MYENSENETWGISLNWRKWSIGHNWPSWTTRAQREKWDKFGVLVWDKESKQVTRLNGKQALDILDLLRNEWESYAEGLTIGEPAWRISLDSPEHKGEPVLTDQMTLTSEQLKALFDFLSREEESLQQLSDHEEQEESRVLGRVYSLLIEAGRKRRQANNPDAEFLP